MNDNYVLNILSKLCDFKTQCRILVERSFLKKLGGGCSAPVGINSVVTEIPNSVEKEFSLTADGGVWSLDGKTEIIDNVSSTFTMEDKKDKEEEEELDVSPSKRQKLDDKSEDKSPEVIDESSLPNSGDKNVNEIVNIHGKVFDVCPYSGQSKTTDKSNKNDKECRSFDPVKLPIGQDFMGECPVLNTEQKINFESGADGLKESFKCPIAGKSFTAPNITSEEINKCPFLHKQKNESVQLIDYEEANSQNISKTEKKSLIENVKEVQLYCGFFCHDESLRPIFNKCEDLGISLAKKLISAGALDVMKVAQDEIHAKC